MTAMNQLKSGENLTHPQPKLGWMLGAVVSVIVLAVVATIGLWIFGKGKRAVTGVTASTTTAVKAAVPTSSGIGGTVFY